ncbi:Teneurin-m [Dirofilaria immitis]
MQIIWSIIILNLFIAKPMQCKMNVKIENGRQLIHIRGREPFLGNYIQLIFSKIHCITSLNVESTIPLTGAEEIELIYKICENDTIWYLTHYSNNGGNFTLHSSIYATVFAITTHRPLDIVNIDTRACDHMNLKKTNIKEIYKKCMPIDRKISHKHKKHQNQRFLILKKRIRVKRSMSLEKSFEFTAENSPYHISKNITIHAEQILKIHAGTVMIFSRNTGIIVRGTLQILGTKYDPVILYSMNGTWNGLCITFANVEIATQSRLIHLNISGSKYGIRIESPLLPQIENVISDSNDNGLTILAYNIGNSLSENILNYTLKKVTAINNRENGISIRVGTREPAHLVLEEIISTSNQVNGLLLEGTLHVIIFSSHFFSNNQDGTSIYLANGSTIEVHNSIFGSNGQHGLQMQNAQQIRVKCFSNSFMDHRFGEAILATFVNRSDFVLDDCRWWNNSGGIAFRYVTESNLHLLNGNWTRNRGTIVLADKINGKTNILIKNNDFQQNEFLINTGVNSVIDLEMTENDDDTHIQIQDNRFFRNTMKMILLIGRIESRNMLTNAKITILENSFAENLILNTVYLATNHVNISYNTFNNSQARCELHSGLEVPMVSINAANNYWGTINQRKVISRICDSQKDKSLIPVFATPFLSTAAEKLSSIITKRTGNSLKVFTTSLIIKKNEAVVFHEGSVLYFKPNHGIIVFGSLHLSGQRDNPVLLKSSSRAPWLGIVLNQGSIINANYCILENAAVGLNVSSTNISIRNIRITRPISTGVLITTSYNGTFDMGESIILQSRRNGIRILKRQIQDVLFLRNALIVDCAEAGIDFLRPAGNIMLQNIVLENSGSFGIFLSQREEDQLDSIILSNLTVRKQERGSAGILLNLKSYHSLNLNISNFVSNVLPSIIIFSKCSLNEKERNKPKILVERNRFAENDNLVMRITLEGCEDAKICRNTFTRNNQDGQKGVLAIYISPKENLQSNRIIDIAQNKFVENNGKWSLFASAVDMNPFNGTIHNNLFSGNQNYRNSLIITSPHFHVNDNEFHQFNWNNNYIYKETLNAARNYWSNDGIPTTEEILDNRWNKMRDQVQVNSIGRKRAAENCLALSNCSRKGQCIGLNVCQCDAGYAGSDCSQISCLALRNCSMNGYCVAPNVCKCFDGWQRQDCSEPTCHSINNCTGHGTCVSLNECDCEPMFAGVDCSKQMTNCSNINCDNHGLCIDNECVCETGWTGPFCSRPLCDQLNNCSGSGICIRPQLCECVHGFAGEDCSICEDPTCDICDAKCIHGHCNRDTKTCICRNDWTGPYCDICAIEKCDVSSVVLYVLPTAAGIHQKDENILVYGNDLPFVSSKRYTCLYGNIASDGFYFSSSLVRCTIPNAASPGRYLFNVIPYGSDKAVPFLDKRLIHFTLYDECNQTDCKGYCVGAVCVCPADRDGIYCEQVKILPKSSHEVLSNKKLIQAVEAEPYIVQMPIQQENTIFSIETDANGMIIYPNGMVFWAQPIGRVHPYSINVTSASLAGECLFSWNLTIKPLYIPVITKVESVDDSNMKVIKGTVNHNAKLIGKVPVRMLVYQNDELVENTTTISTADGHFEFKYHPFGETISTSVIVMHPAAKFDGEQIEEDYQITNNGKEILVNCQVELIIPRDKIQIMKYEKIVKGIAINETKPMKITFTAGGTIDNTILLLQFKCVNTPKKLVRQQIEIDGKRSIFASYPLEILISNTVQIPPKIITVDIINKEGYRFVVTPRISIQPGRSPLFLVSTRPTLENFTEFSNPESTLTLFLSYRQLTETVNLTTDGDLILFEGNKQLFTVKYRNYAALDLFDFRVTIVDELSALDPTHIINDAEIVLRNDVLGYDDKRQTKSSASVVFFSIIEGTYQLTVRSPTHQLVTMIVQPSFINSSLLVFAPINSPYSPIIEDGKLSLEEISKKHKLPFPKLHFTPPTILVALNGTDEEVKLLISSDSDGPSDHIAILPSIEIRDEYLPFSLTAADLANGIGRGDGYYMKCKLSRISNQSERATGCTVFALQIPYIYMVPALMSSYVRNIMILADNRNERNDKVHLCKVTSVGLQTAFKETSIWTKTTIYCNCGIKIKKRCRKQYISAAICGPAWKHIPDDTVSLQTTAMFILMMAECRMAKVDFHKIRQFLACASSLDKQCPISQQRVFTKNKSSWKNQRRIQFFDQLALVNEQADDILKKYFPILKVESQTVDIVALYSTFFERLNILLPFKYFKEINNRQWFDKFFESISDSSESGPAISETEFEKLKKEKEGINLVRRWNATVVEWSVTPSLSLEANFSGMKFTDARELVIQSDRLKTLTRQYGDENPFALLHSYMGKLISWSLENVSGSQQTMKFGNDDEDICAYAYSLVTPERPYENSEFHITLRVINKKKEPLEFVTVKLEMIRSLADTARAPLQFRIGPVVLDGINDINRASKLLPNASFVANWSLKPIKKMRLIREAEYQASLILKFVRGGRRSIQRIATQPVIFRPRLSLKIYYFILNLTRLENTKKINTSLPIFNVMIALMNTGYSHLKNVKMEEIRISVVSHDNVKKFVPYQMSGIVSSNGVEDRVLTDLHFTIANIESGKTVHVVYNISTDFEQKGIIRDFKVITSVNGELIELEDSQIFIIHQFISPTKFLISLQTNPALLFYYDMQKSIIRTIVPLVFVSVNEKSDTSDGKPFRQQIASFRFNESRQQLASLYGRIPYPVDLEHDFEVLRINQIGKNNVLKLINPRHVWTSNTDKEFVHFIDDNPPARSELIEYEIIYGSMEVFLRPHFEFPVYHIPLVTVNWPHIGDEIARIVATSASQSDIRYELYSNSNETDFFSINPETGVIHLKKEMLPPETKNSYCLTIRAIDDHGRSQTTVVTIGFNDFVKECYKLDNFNGLQPLTYIPAQSRLTEPIIKTDVNNYTSKMSKLYSLSDTRTASLSSAFPSAITDEIETFKIKGYPVKSSVTRKHEYTKLIATQSVSDLILGSSSPLQLSSTIISESNSGADSELDSGLDSSIVSNIDSTVSITENDLKMHRTENTEKGRILSHEEIYDESDRTNRGEIIRNDGYRSGSGDGRWYSTSQRSDISSTNTVDFYRTMDHFSISSESGISTVSFTFINDSTDNNYETSEGSDINLLGEKDVSSTDSKEVPEFYPLFSSKAAIETSLFPTATLIHTTLSSSHQYMASIYNFSTTNTNYFHSSNNNLEAELPSSENNGKPTTAIRKDLFQKSSLHKSTYYTPTSSIPQITGLSENGNAELTNIQPPTKVSTILSAGETFAKDKENISKLACQLKDTQPIWSLICDLSKTSKNQKLLKTRSKTDLQKKMKHIKKK